MPSHAARTAAAGRLARFSARLNRSRAPRCLADTDQIASFRRSRELRRSVTVFADVAKSPRPAGRPLPSWRRARAPRAVTAVPPPLSCGWPTFHRCRGMGWIAGWSRRGCFETGNVSDASLTFQGNPPVFPSPLVRLKSHRLHTIVGRTDSIAGHAQWRRSGDCMRALLGG